MANRILSCDECSKPLAPPKQRFCSDTCRYRHRDRSRRWDHKRKLKCAVCDKRIYQGPSSLPQGEATCRDCREAARAARRGPAVVRDAGQLYLFKIRRDYGFSHRRLRAALLEKLRPGDPCARCEGPILEGDPVDLDHADDGVNYIGLSHAWCNRARKPVPRRGPSERMCAVCGAKKPDSRTKTCSRACGVEIRRRNAA